MWGSKAGSATRIVNSIAERDALLVKRKGDSVVVKNADGTAQEYIWDSVAWIREFDGGGGTITDNIIIKAPAVIRPETPDTSSIGTVTHPFGDVFIGPASLYVDGNKVIDSVSTTLNVQTSVDQHLAISTSGLGTTRLASAKEVILYSGADLNIQALGDIGVLGSKRIDFTSNASGSDIVFETQSTLGQINFKSLNIINFDSPNIKFMNTPTVGTNVIYHAGNLSAATISVTGLMSAADKGKLDGISAGATNYVHPVGDGNLHVPATGTTNNGKILRAGATAGSLSWADLNFSEIIAKPNTLEGYGITNGMPTNGNAITSGIISIGGGRLAFTAGTGSIIDFGVNGRALPNSSLSSAGSKIRLFGTGSDGYAVGFGITDENTVWYSSGEVHKWYTQNKVVNATPTNIMTLDAAGNLTARTFVSNVIIGTAPFAVTSTTMVDNLNVRYLNGKQNIDFVPKAITNEAQPAAGLIEGLTWYQVSTDTAQMYLNGAFRNVGGIQPIVNANQPAIPKEGMFWLNPSTNILQMYINGAFRAVGNSGTALNPLFATVTLGADAPSFAHGVATYNPLIDVMMVFKGGGLLQKGVEWSLSSDNLSIQKMLAYDNTVNWLSGSVFDIVVIQSVPSSNMLQTARLKNLVPITVNGTTNIAIGIPEYNPDTDVLDVTLLPDNIPLAENENYQLNANRISIDLVGPNFSLTTTDKILFYVWKQVRTTAGALDGSMFVDNTISDNKLGFRTADPTKVPTTSTGKMQDWVNWMTNRLKVYAGTVNWYDTPTFNLTSGGSVTRITLTQATGTAPMTITSTTKVINLNVDQVDGVDVGGGVGQLVQRDGNGDITGRILVSTMAIGTSPLSITSTTKVPNLNVSFVNGWTLDQGVTIGSTPTFAGLKLTGVISLGNTAGQKIYVYDDGIVGAGSIRAGLGVDLSGSSRELSMFHSSSNHSDGKISFGHRYELDGTYTERMSLTGAGMFKLTTIGGGYYGTIELNQAAIGNCSGLWLKSMDTGASGQGAFLLYGDGTMSYENFQRRLCIASTANSSAGTGSRGIVFSLQGGSEGEQDFRISNGNNLVSTVFIVKQNTGNTTISGFCSATSYPVNSDSALKENILPIDNALEKVGKINGITFDWNDKYEYSHSAQRQAGVIAQEVETVLPEIVSTGENGYKQVDYSRLTPLLIEAIKELNQKVKDLEAQLKS